MNHDDIDADKIDDGYLRICGTCFRLYEAGRPDGQEQRCSCSSVEEENWPGRDYNERARLCGCCGMEVLDSGSRWSPFFCRECQLLAMGASLWERRLVLPIGRHSMMHSWVPQPRKPSRAARAGRPGHVAETVHEAITAIVRGSDGLMDWSALIVCRHLKRLRLAGGTSVAAYLRAMADDEEPPTRWALFAELCEFMRTPSPGPQAH